MKRTILLLIATAFILNSCSAPKSEQEQIRDKVETSLKNIDLTKENLAQTQLELQELRASIDSASICLSSIQPSSFGPLKAEVMTFLEGKYAELKKKEYTQRKRLIEYTFNIQHYHEGVDIVELVEEKKEKEE